MDKYLSGIDTPADLQKLNNYQIEALSREIREYLINSISKTGGHLASNLGIVELTLALHTVFDTLQDKIVWDVGHQCYVHKLITGRKEKFHTLRQYKGLSGFPKRSESPHDHFNTGHSSTSISAALGMAIARDLDKKDHSVVSVIGDGALTGGLAFEALNHAGQGKKNMLVVLNDNEMSISQNVGGLSNYLNKIRTNAIYSKVKDDFESLINHIPGFGKTVIKTAEKAKERIKYLFVPGVLFEELGFNYIGPIDGHNYGELCKVFSAYKNMKGPVLVHVITKKGKGYAIAEKQPDKFHGVGAFDIVTGAAQSKNKKKSYSQIAGDTLINCAKKDKRVVAITAAMPGGTGLKEFSKKFTNRFFDVGIAEQHAITLAAGMAAEGYKPFVAIYSTFLQRGYDQIIHDVCLQNLPVTFLVDRAGLVGADGETHHGVFDISYLLSIPNLTVMAPKDGLELEEMIKYSLGAKFPISIRYPRGEAEQIELPSNKEIKLGQGEILYEKGEDALIIPVGHMNSIALQVARKLYKNKTIKTTVINPRFVKPLDKNLIVEYASRNKWIYVLEDNVKLGGFGIHLQAILNEYNISSKVEVIALPDKFIEHGKVELLYDLYGLNIEKLYKKIVDDLGKIYPKNIAATR